jgi:hypothetical protein
MLTVWKISYESCLSLSLTRLGFYTIYGIVGIISLITDFWLTPTKLYLQSHSYKLIAKADESDYYLSGLY